jgi:DNA-binding NarL/FixJ family response regulator
MSVSNGLKNSHKPIHLSHPFKAYVWPHVGDQEFTMQPSKSNAYTPSGGLYGTRLPSPRQQQVIELVAQGLKNCEVAEIIGTSEYVVKNHLRIIFDKLGFWNRVELALWYEARRHESIAENTRDRAMA